MRHVCRTDSSPDSVVRTFDRLQQNPEVYYTMSGPSEFHVVGALNDWNTVDRLSEIHVPPLITSGRYDEATPAIAEVVHHGIMGVIFEASARCAHAEAPDKYCAAVDGFVPRVEELALGGPGMPA